MKPPAMSTAMTLPAGRMTRRPRGLVDAERLERARDAVPQVRADDQHAEHVERDHQRILEVLHLQAIQIASAGRPLVLGAVPERLDVDERNTSSHRPETIIVDEAKVLRLGAPGALLLRVRDRPRLLVAEEHRDRLVDVDQEDQQQADLDDRQQRIAFERVRVPVEDAGTEEDHRLPAM